MDQDLPSVPGMNLSRPDPEGTAAAQLVREDPVPTVLQGPGPTVLVQDNTVQLQGLAPTARRRGLMAREDRVLMVRHRVNSVPQVHQPRRALAPAQDFSAR